MYDPSFYAWLLTQKSDTLHGKPTAIAQLAVEAAADRFFPKRTRRLYVLLDYYKHRPHVRNVVLAAHALWRASRRAEERRSQ